MDRERAKSREELIAEAIIAGRQSPNWEQFKNSKKFIARHPFSEGLPPGSRDNAQSPNPQLYNLILRSNQRVVGYPVFSPFEKEEDARWRVFSDGKIEEYPKSVVVAWKERPKRQARDVKL